jgi:cell division transport system permease protein
MSITYILKEGVAGFKRNISTSLITIFTVGISLLLLGFFGVITMNFSSLVDQIRNRVELEVFLKEDVNAAQQKQIGKSLKSFHGVKEVTFISKDEAAKIFRKELGEDFFDVLNENPLPVSYRVAIQEGYNTTDSVRMIVSRTEKMEGVESVVYRKQFLLLVDKRARAFRLATLFIGIILAVSSVILVANTIRLTIAAKREMIRTMKLVGATTLFIRLPFLIEGFLHGLIGGIFASLLIEIVFAFFIQPIAQDLLMSITIDLSFYLFLIITGCVLGLAGSIISIRKFLYEALAAPA